MSGSGMQPSKDWSMHPLDAVAVAAEHHTVLLENDRVRVLDTRFLLIPPVSAGRSGGNTSDYLPR